jgi:hypothetical protein
VPIVALYERVYLMIASPKGERGKALPVGSLDDFVNLYGSSDAIILNSIEAYLKNARFGLYVFRVTPYPVATVRVTAVGGGTYAIMILGQVITVTLPTGATMPATIGAFAAAINNNPLINLYVEAERDLDANGAVILTSDRFFVRSKNGETFAIARGSENVAVTDSVASTNPMALSYWDYLRGVAEIAEAGQYWPLGYLCFPQAYFNTASLYQRLQIRNAHETAAARLRWSAIPDPGHPDTIRTPLQAVDDFGSHSGLSAVYWPYLIDDDDDFVAPSVMTACYAMMCHRNTGIQKAPAGNEYPFRGISRTAYALKAAELDYLADSKINPMLELQGRGVVPYDIMTRSADPNFRFNHTVTILNCVERSIFLSVQASNILFQPIDANFFLILRSIINQPLARGWEARWFAGVRIEDAYEVRCDADMQNSDDIEQYGRILAEVFVVPIGAARQIRIPVFRVPIGRLDETLQIAAMR